MEDLERRHGWSVFVNGKEAYTGDELPSHTSNILGEFRVLSAVKAFVKPCHVLRAHLGHCRRGLAQGIVQSSQSIEKTWIGASMCDLWKGAVDMAMYVCNACLKCRYSR